MKYKVGDIVMFKSFSFRRDDGSIPLCVGKIIELPKTYIDGTREPFDIYTIGTSDGRYRCFNPIRKANKFFRKLYEIE